MADEKKEGTDAPKPAAQPTAAKPAAAQPAAAKPQPAAAKETPTGSDGATPPDDSPIYQRVKERLPDALDVDSHIDRGDLVLVAKLERVHELCRFLRDDPELKFDYLPYMTAIDFPKRDKRFTMVWTLQSTTDGRRFHLVAVAGEGSEVPSVADIWRTANWHERECYDMFGIRFAGHPDLRRILLPEWWEGFPLRKDYPVEGRGEHELVVEECLRPQA